MVLKHVRDNREIGPSIQVTPEVLWCAVRHATGESRLGLAHPLQVFDLIDAALLVLLDRLVDELREFAIKGRVFITALLDCAPGVAGNRICLGNWTAF